MANTGNIIVTERDINPFSPTYDTTRTRTYEDTEMCPTANDPIWSEQSRSCENYSGYNTGRILIVEEDVNPNSDTYGQTRNRTLSDANCQLTNAKVLSISYLTNRSYHTACNTLTDLYEEPGKGYGADHFVVGTCVTSIDGYYWNYPSVSDYLKSVILPDTIIRIGDYFLRRNRGLESVTVFATTPPTLGNNAFSFAENFSIFVPAESVNAYKNASGWSTYASRIQAIPS